MPLNSVLPLSMNECDAGCPSCVTANPTGLENRDLQDLLEESNASVACTRSLIHVLLTGNIELPEVILHKHPLPKGRASCSRS